MICWLMARGVSRVAGRSSRGRAHRLKPPRSGRGRRRGRRGRASGAAPPRRALALTASRGSKSASRRAATAAEMAGSLSAATAFSERPLFCDSPTSAPTMWCALRKGIPARARATASPAVIISSRPAAARIISRLRPSPRTTPVMTETDPIAVSAASKTASLSSCRSFWYPAGRPFSRASSRRRSPSTRAVLPRTSSSASGFFFCGMRLEPVVKASGSVTKPYSGPAKWMRSSAIRARCVCSCAQPKTSSTAKSRSMTASRAFSETAAKPRSRAIPSRSRGSDAPARAPEPRGRTSTRARASRKRSWSRTRPQAWAAAQ